MKKKKALNALEKHESKTKEANESDEYFRQVDAPGGWKYVKQYEEAEAKKARVKKGDELFGLGGKKKSRFAYIRGMADLLQAKLDKIDWDKGWEAAAIPTSGSPISLYGNRFETEEGVVMVVRSNWGKVATWAVKAVFKPNEDLKSMGVFAQRAEDLQDATKGILSWGHDKMMDQFKKTKSGIIVP